MKRNILPSIELLNELFELKNGTLFRKKSVSKNTKIGDKVGTISSNGYLQIRIEGKLYAGHRIIYKMATGKEPETLDHIDGNRLNNSLDNLREVNASQNATNAKKIKNSSGYKNVIWNKPRNKWLVKLMVNGKQKYIAETVDLNLANQIAIQAREKYHGDYARHY